MPPHDQTMPQGQWQFNDEVATVFDDMLARSIPQYETMRHACYSLANRYRQPDSCIIDLGCSRGEAMAPLVDKFGVHNHFIGVETSPPMAEAARQRFKGYIDAGVVQIKQEDLRTYYPPALASVTLSILTLQFTPIEYRQKILKNIYDHLLPGGALILVEKVLGATADLDSLMVELYYGLKADNGYSQEQIERKRLSLEGVLVPVTADWNEQLLAQTGFKQIDCFWRWMNFCGWVAVKC